MIIFTLSKIFVNNTEGLHTCNTIKKIQDSTNYLDVLQCIPGLSDQLSSWNENVSKIKFFYITLMWQLPDTSPKTHFITK